MPDSHKAVSTISPRPVVYPFSAIVGQDEMKLGLLLTVVDPLLGGVLIMGHRGTAKSTAVRGLASLLPQIKVVRGCVFGCAPDDESGLCPDCRLKVSLGQKLQAIKRPVPVVDLPLGATEDRLCGTIDIEKALLKGQRSFEPGLLARANRGLLYIDEVNLLDDHLVDVLLDVSVSGLNRVEREGISIEHASRFVLIGSGNPEEGELRPQLLDRFGLHVEVSTDADVDRRVEIVERRDLFERNPEKFRQSFQEEEDRLRRDITRAQKKLESVKIEPGLVRKIVELCVQLKVDGHRGELTITRAARTLAALENRRNVTEADVRRVSVIALRHRLRRGPFDETGGSQQIKETLDRVFEHRTTRRSHDPGNDDDHSGNGQPARPSDRKRPTSSAKRSSNATGAQIESKLQGVTNHIDSHFESELKASREAACAGNDSSRRTSYSKGCLNRSRGRYSRSIAFADQGARVALDATIRVAALQSHTPFHSGEAGIRISPTHLRYKQFTRKSGRLFVLTIDTSGSMAMERIEKARQVALGLLRRSYLRRDSVAMVVFRVDRAEVVLPPSQSMLRAKRTLDSLAVGGGTPLCAGISQALDVVKQSREKRGNAVILLFTDGGANVPMKREARGAVARRTIIESELTNLGAALRRASINAVVLDTQNRFSGSNQAKEVAENLRAGYLQM